ncbi:MAG: ribonuclease III [Gammaproteobacteria bacterium]
MQNLSDRLGYHFRNLNLLEQALRHRSVGASSNERLEFLGDSILNFVIAAELFQIYPKYDEGELSCLRAALVNGKILAQIGKELQVGDYLFLGVGEIKSGGSKRSSILADAVEAIIGAIFLDGGIDACKDRILAWFKDRIAKTTLLEHKDPKTKLQEIVQKNKLPLPNYEITRTEGAAHAQTFHVKCCVEGLDQVTFGAGSSRRQAEQDAAEKFLLLLGNKIPIFK